MTIDEYKERLWRCRINHLPHDQSLKKYLLLILDLLFTGKPTHKKRFRISG